MTDRMVPEILVWIIGVIFHIPPIAYFRVCGSIGKLSSFPFERAQACWSIALNPKPFCNLLVSLLTKAYGFEGSNTGAS